MLKRKERGGIMRGLDGVGVRNRKRGRGGMGAWALDDVEEGNNHELRHRERRHRKRACKKTYL